MENYFKTNIDETISNIRNEIESEKKDIDMLYLYKEVISGKDGKQFNKNVKEIRSVEYSFSLDKSGSKSYKLFIADYRKNQRYSKCVYLTGYQIAYIPEGKTNEVLNIYNLYAAIDELIEDKRKRISQLEKLDINMLNNLCDEAYKLKQQIEEFSKKFDGYGYFNDRFTLSELLDIHREFQYIRI